MSSSESEFEPVPDSPESSLDGRFDGTSERNKRRLSLKPVAGRKRRRQSRSSSLESNPVEITRDVQGLYNDEYRTLFNDTVTSAAARFTAEPWLLRGGEPQIGLSRWSLEEKTTFFAALEKLGKDDVPGIAKAIGSKSAPEARQYLLLLEDAATKQNAAKVKLCDIPAAAEIGTECDGHLDVAADALAWKQEQFEAKREQEQYGQHWLITPEIAEEIEAAHAPSRRSSFASSPPPSFGGEQSHEQRLEQLPQEKPAKPQILQDIPEGDLLVPEILLKLSSTIFMNGSPSQPSCYPHWSTLVSPLASKPSIYRTALTDFHALVVSLTMRLTQASILQATSRLRAQGWRTRKGVNPLVKRRDVLAAIDMLRVQRDGKERWKKVARRCGLRVFEGVGRSRREVDWKEAEQILDSAPKFQDLLTTDDERAGLTSDLDDDNFKRRAIRSGTPLPTRDQLHSESGGDNDEDEDDHGQDDNDDSDIDDSGLSETSLSVAERPRTLEELEELELQELEQIDAKASREEEVRLLGLLGVLSHSTEPTEGDAVEVKAEEGEIPTGRSRNRLPKEPDWRTWTDYCADWEDLPTPVPAATFQANQKSPSPAPVPSTEPPDVETGLSSGAEGLRSGRSSKRRKVAETELPIRGARAYAALREGRSGSEAPHSGNEGSADDDANWPAPSIENPGISFSRAASHSADDMDWDAKSALHT